MNIEHNKSLEYYNTFRINTKAKYFFSFQSVKDLDEIFNYKDFQSTKKMVLGGGSNMLLVNDFDGIILKNDLKGIVVKNQQEYIVHVKVQGGENWHQFVLWCLERDFGGVENLSLIPGTVGAAPIQNIGAYGVELKDVFHELTAYNIQTKSIETFTLKQCEFGYRDSIFKSKIKGKYIILSVTFKLTTKHHSININYGAIQNVLNDKNISNPTIQDISRAVIKIRSSKLPNPDEIGNSGSFFKNPEVEVVEFERLQKQFPNIVFYNLPNGKVKIPAGWLIEQCGWKGKRVGNTGAYAKQALVLVNYGNATGKEVWNLALEIKASVKEKFGISIIPEVNIIK
ncbi:MAG: UDP-N-acetylmuramate dehydrogenase [Saprospiraceae bacterium]